MNIVFSFVFLILVLIPGHFFKVSYFEVEYNRSGIKFTIGEELLSLIIASFLFQVPFYFLINLVCDVDEKKLYLLFINSESVNRDPLRSTEIGAFSLYTLMVSAIAFLAGRQLQKYIVQNSYDIRYRVFGIYSDWHNLFKGRLLNDFGELMYPDGVSAVWVDVLTNTGTEEIIYSGFLSYYSLNEKDEIDRINLKGVMRRKLSEDKKSDKTDDKIKWVYLNESSDVEDSENSFLDIADTSIDSRYYQMPGDYFVLKGNEIKNMNITYYLEQDEEEFEEELEASLSEENKGEQDEIGE